MSSNGEGTHLRFWRSGGRGGRRVSDGQSLSTLESCLWKGKGNSSRGGKNGTRWIWIPPTPSHPLKKNKKAGNGRCVVNTEELGSPSLGFSLSLFLSFCGQLSLSGVLFCCSPPAFLKQVLSLNLELSDVARLASQCASQGSPHLPSPKGHGMCHCASPFSFEAWMLGDLNWGPVLGRHFTGWEISLVLLISLRHLKEKMRQKTNKKPPQTFLSPVHHWKKESVTHRGTGPPPPAQRREARIETRPLH